MKWIILGLGNPGERYKGTRHNTGRIVIDALQKKEGFSDWEMNGKYKAFVSEGKIGKDAVLLAKPETFMNNSGETVGKIKDLSSKTVGKGKDKRIEIGNLVVVHDDLDIPFGRFKISFNKSAGGHRGALSVIKAVKTEAFTRVRIGISRITSSGKIKKTAGEEAVLDFILQPFRKSEADTLKEVATKAAEAIAMIVSEGREAAMGKYN